MNNLFWIAAGGAIGSLFRYLLHKISLDMYVGHFPLGTFVVNILGAAAIGFIWAYTEAHSIPEHLRLFLIIGILGGFTTFSSFALETFNLIRFDKMGIAALYVSLSNIVGFLAVAFAFRITKSMWG